jgi:soluble lytic murein transglycosylase-like protein
MKSRTIFSGLLLAAATASALPVRADYAVLRSGSRLHITGYAQDGDRVRLSVQGGYVEITAAELLAVEPEDVFPAPPPASIDPVVRYGEFIHKSALKHGVDENLIKHVVAAESNFNPKAVSRKNALGLMQLLPETATRYGVTHVFDPAENIDGGTHYLKDLLARYSGNLSLALAAYNAGPEMVDRYGGVPPFSETQNYVKQITSKIAADAQLSPQPPRN